MFGINKTWVLNQNFSEVQEHLDLELQFGTISVKKSPGGKMQQNQPSASQNCQRDIVKYGYNTTCFKVSNIGASRTVKRGVCRLSQIHCKVCLVHHSCTLRLANG